MFHLLRLRGRCSAADTMSAKEWHLSVQTRNTKLRQARSATRQQAVSHGAQHQHPSVCAASKCVVRSCQPLDSRRKMSILQAAASDSDDELFRVRGGDGGGARSGAEADAAAELDALDSSRAGGGAASGDLARWDAAGAAEALRDRFVTGAEPPDLQVPVAQPPSTTVTALQGARSILLRRQRPALRCML